MDVGPDLARDQPLLERTKTILVVAIALTVPLGVIPANLFGQPLFLFDLPLALLYPIAGRSLLASSRTGGRCRLGLLPSAFVTFMALCGAAYVVHPSVAGAVLLVRLGGGAILVWTVSGLSPRSAAYAVGALLASAMLQSGIAFAQYFHRGPIGLSMLGEGSAPLNRLGDVLIPRGTFDHQYPLTAFCLLAAIVGGVIAGQSRHPWRWSVASLIAVAPLGITFSRSGVLGLALALACLLWAAWRHDRKYALAVICLVLGLVVPATWAHRAWTGRLYQTVHSPTVNAFSSGRVRMYTDSVAVSRANPIIGTGPGRSAAGQLPVNDVVLLISEQAGVVAALVAAGVVVLLAKRAFEAGSLAGGLYLALLPFLVFDFFLYGIPQGPAMAGLWAGALCSPLVRYPSRAFLRPSRRV